MPGWTDPTQSATTATITTDTTPAPVTSLDTLDIQKVAAIADLKPSLRPSTVTRPMPATTQTDRPSLRKTSGINGHPVRDLAKSLGSTVRKALGQDDAKAADKSSTGADTKAAKPAA